MRRPIVTSYYRGKALVKATMSSHPNNAVVNAIGHMQINEYQATTCEVYDGDSGELHAVIRRKMNADIEILFRREVVRKDFEPIPKTVLTAGVES